MNLTEWSKEIHQNAVDHGWYAEPRSFGDVIALCHSELSEALEEHRMRAPDLYTDVATGKPEGKAVEMADCIIRILDWAGANGIDMEEVVRRKHEYNKSRPYRHGNKAL